MTNEQWNAMAAKLADSIEPHIGKRSVIMIVLEDGGHKWHTRCLRKGIDRDEASAVLWEMSDVLLSNLPEPTPYTPPRQQ